MAEEVKEVILKVEEARQQDVNRGIARLDIEQAEKLGLETGDVIGIFGTRETAQLARIPGGCGKEYYQDRWQYQAKCRCGYR